MLSDAARMRVYFLVPEVEMVQRSIRFCATLVIAIVSVSRSTAQNLGECDSALKQSVESYRSDDSVRLVWLQTLDRGSFEQIKREGSAGATVLIKGVPLKGYADYKDFKDALEFEKRSLGFDYAEGHSLGYVRTYLSKESGSAYATCLETKTKGIFGLHVWAVSGNTNRITVNIRWIPPNGIPKSKLEVALLGTKSDPTVQQFWGPGAEDHQYTFQRNGRQDIQLDFNMASYSDSISYPGPPAPPKNKCIYDFVMTSGGLNSERSNLAVRYGPATITVTKSTGPDGRYRFGTALNRKGQRGEPDPPVPGAFKQGLWGMRAKPALSPPWPDFVLADDSSVFGLVGDDDHFWITECRPANTKP